MLCQCGFATVTLTTFWTVTFRNFRTENAVPHKTCFTRWTLLPKHISLHPPHLGSVPCNICQGRSSFIKCNVAVNVKLRCF